jgi:hypothetical protein
MINRHRHRRFDSLRSPFVATVRFGRPIRSLVRRKPNIRGYSIASPRTGPPHGYRNLRELSMVAPARQIQLLNRPSSRSLPTISPESPPAISLQPASPCKTQSKDHQQPLITKAPCPPPVAIRVHSHILWRKALSLSRSSDARDVASALSFAPPTCSPFPRRSTLRDITHPTS